jgi:enoyl-CoA hydratase/carnithine racemase
VGTAVERSVELLDRMMGEPDYAEGVRAYVEKRPPRFPDR